MKIFLIKLSIFTIFSFSSIYTQDCLELPEIEGTECMSCAPDGWEQFPTPDIVDNSGSWQYGGCMLNMPGPIPNGDAASLFVGASWGAEGIYTTIDGLVPGESYGLGFYWASITSYECSGTDYFTDPSTLVLTIGNEVYEYEGADFWEYHEICFEADNEEIDIMATNSAVQNVAALLFDLADCSEVTSCCPLILSIEENEFDVCPDDEIVFDVEYNSEEGSVSINWTSLPESALDYLSDPSALNPSFLFPTDYPIEEQIIEYMITIEDDFCHRSNVIYVNVHQNIKPEFDIELCEIYDPYFPNVSNDYFTGTWNGDFDLEGLGGTYQNFLFLLESGQDNCTEEWNYVLFVDHAIELKFELTKNYCKTDNNLYSLPEESIGGYYGEWDIDEFIPADLPLGSHEFIFTVYPEEVCAYEYILKIEIVSPDSLIFEIPNEFCATADSLLLPDTSIMGIMGLWSKPLIDLSIIGVDTVTFSPQDGCFEDYNQTIAVVGTIHPTFEIPDSLCEQTEVVELDSMSIDGFSGSWIPSSINFDTISMNSIELSWYADSIYSCLNDTTVTISIYGTTIPTFNLIDEFCINYGTYIFPSSSIEEIEGYWLLPIIETRNLNPGIYTNTFYPLPGNCSDTINFNFKIIELQNPIFNIQEEICPNEDSFLLPIESENGIVGTWSLSEIDPSAITDSIMIFFIPEDTLCNSLFSEAIYILENIDPIFNLPEFLCAEDGDFVFPMESNNGISGSWDIVEFDPISFEGFTFINTFVPDNLDCSNEFYLELPVIDFSNLIVEISEAESCIDEFGKINIQHDSIEIMFSIDNGLGWIFETTNNIDIDVGTHEILIQDLKGLCQTSIEVQIEGLIQPDILGTNVMFVSDCGLNDGSIIVLADGTNFEYSLNGLDWSYSNEFEGLSEGEYIVYVRDKNYHDCIDSVTVLVLSPPEIEIIDYMSINPIDCEYGLGSAIVTVNESNVEFSIDGGYTWQDSNVFNDLEPGDYTVIVRYEDTEFCTEYVSFSIVRPECEGCEEISVSYEVTPVDCLNPISGSAEITNINGPDTLEYNILWENNTEGIYVTNLSEGWYYLSIEYGDDCVHADSVFVESIDPISFDLFSYDQNCQELGSIEVTNFMGGSGLPMYSIDGFNFQDEGVFTNLSADEYQVLVETLFNCNAVNTIEINDNSDLQIDIPAIPAIEIGDTITLNPLINQNTIDDFEWTPLEGIINSGDLVIEVAPTETMSYTLTIYFGDCVESRSVLVEVLQKEDVFIPSIFSPNGDGSNDIFYLMGSQNSNFTVDQMSIFDRWGNLVFYNSNFEINNPEAGWNGSFNGSDAGLGVYVYSILLNWKGQTLIRIGNITVVR